jgi:hypothetical protein
LAVAEQGAGDGKRSRALVWWQQKEGAGKVKEEDGKEGEEAKE